MNTKKEKALKDEVDRIIEEGQGERDGGRLSVIVSLTPTDEKVNERLFNTASEVFQRRSATLTARDVLPESQETLKELYETASTAPREQLSAHTRRTLQAARYSLAAELGTDVSAVSTALQPQSGRQVIAQVLQNPLVQRTRSETARQEVPTLPSSRSLVLNMAKDDLARLPAEVPQIQGVYPNRALRLPPLTEVKNVPREVQEQRTSSWGVRKISALSVWGAYDARGQKKLSNGQIKKARVAVLDTGADRHHPDLIDREGNSKITAWAEFDADGHRVPESAEAYDSDQHGTHCAGTIAGGNASGSWIGVAPEAELAVGLVLKGGGGTDAQILAGLNWAIEQQVDVISMLLGGLSLDVETQNPHTETLMKALASGIPVVTSIGNDGSQTTGAPGNDLFAFAVGATDHADNAAGFSGGRTHVIRRSEYLPPEILPLSYSKPEVMAPGVAIRSSIPGDPQDPESYLSAYASFNGTSMAAPHVAGAIALLLSATEIGSDEKVPREQRAFVIQDLLTGTVEELGKSGQDHDFGFGRVDALLATVLAQRDITLLAHRACNVLPSRPGSYRTRGT